MRKTLKIVLLKTSTSWEKRRVFKALHSKELSHDKFLKDGRQFLMFIFNVSVLTSFVVLRW